MTVPIFRQGYAGVDVEQASALAQRHQLGGTGADSRSARADALTLHTAAADPHTGYVLESLLDAKGDLIAASADNTPGKLTVGSNNAVLLADSTQTLGMRWDTAVKAPAAVRTKRTADQTLSNNTITALTWDDETYDTQAMHSTVSNTNRLTVPSGWDGLWHVEMNLEFEANATGFRGIHIKHSTSGGTETVIAKFYLPNTGVAISPILHCGTDYRAVATDYFYAEAWQTSGGNLRTGHSVWDFLLARWAAL